jgi:UDP-glucuronate decarboxylase
VPVSIDPSAGQRIVQEDLERLSQRLEAEFRVMAGKHLLVTGGGGFLGYYLVQAVTHWNRTRSGHEIQITVVENGARGIGSWLRGLTGAPGFTLLLHDVTLPLPAELAPLDYVIHAAGIASPTFYRQHPLETMDANVVGLRLLLEKARAQGEQGQPLAGFLFLSSSEIYGDPTPENIPTPETYRGNVSCTGPRACYDESKRYGETLSVVFARSYGVPVTIARPFNNYGPGLGLHDGRVIPDFARCILEGRDIVMHSDGTPTRTFCYTADAISGYYKVLMRGRPGEAYNIGVESPEISMREVAELLSRLGGELFGYRGQVTLQPSAERDYLVDNPQRRCPVILKARNEVGYDPEVTLEEGLRRSLLWYAAEHQARSC